VLGSSVEYCWSGSRQADESAARVAWEAKNCKRSSHARCPLLSGPGQLCHTNKNKAARRTRARYYRHLLLLLLLPFILSILFREEVDEHNSHHSGSPVIDSSEELVGVTNVLKRWYKLFRQTTPANTPADIGILLTHSNRFIVIQVIRIIRIIHIM
jgi:hypothetical protein